MSELLGKVRRGLRKPPRILVQRLKMEARTQADRYISRSRPNKLTRERLAWFCGARDLGELWQRLAKSPFPAVTSDVSAAKLERCCPGMQAKIRAEASRALERRVNILGTGDVRLGQPIDWVRDYKTNYRWPLAYAKGIEYSNLDRPSDVKVPWEISRLQWLIPAGQAYVVTRDEQYARLVRDVIEEWIEANPYAHSVNWSCTMEVAMRILSFTWFFHVFNGSEAWKDDEFRFRFLRLLYLHGEYTERNLEISDIAGNHYTADAAGLVFAGLFFGSGKSPERWARLGWEILCKELPRQVYPDGVDFEASVPYHRLVQELFLFPALYRISKSLCVEDSYRNRVHTMVHFSVAYSQPHGSVPVWGDADDARALPLGCQELNDHRYLAGLGAAAWSSEELARMSSGPLDEAFWVFGPKACEWLSSFAGTRESTSTAFRHGGFYVMRNTQDHVFIDCGPVGLGGRGGHGHNDCLSLEAVLDGERLITDCGAYVYTASTKDRNLFRSTAYHNTPQVDGQEMNRFIAWNALWTLHYDALPELRRWIAGELEDEFEGAHAGYRKLAHPVVPVRNVRLHHLSHQLTIRDSFEGSGEHRIEVPLHLHPRVEVELDETSGSARLMVNGKVFEIVWDDAGAWDVSIEPARVSPSYGIVVPSKKIVWRREGPLQPLTVEISCKRVPVSGEDTRFAEARGLGCVSIRE